MTEYQEMVAIAKRKAARKAKQRSALVQVFAPVKKQDYTEHCIVNYKDLRYCFLIGTWKDVKIIKVCIGVGQTMYTSTMTIEEGRKLYKDILEGRA